MAGWDMSAHRTILCIGIAASLALFGHAAAQPRFAVTPPTNNVDTLETPVTPSLSPFGRTVLPSGVSPMPYPVAGGARMSPSGARELRGNPLWVVPLKSLNFTRDQPLFTPSRRPPAPPVAHVESPPPLVAARSAEPERPQLVLVGVVVGETEGIAIFLDERTREVIRLRKNEGHAGWILRSVHGREATLQKASLTAVLVIPTPGGA
jgi:hypothetical protein